MGQGDVTIVETKEEWLDVGNRVMTAGPVANVADCRVAHQAFQLCRVCEDLRQQSPITVLVQLLAIARNNSGTLLSPVLQGMETVVGQLASVGRPEDAEDATLFI